MQDMKRLRGYQTLAIFLQQRMQLIGAPGLAALLDAASTGLHLSSFQPPPSPPPWRRGPLPRPAAHPWCPLPGPVHIGGPGDLWVRAGAVQQWAGGRCIAGLDHLGGGAAGPAAGPAHLLPRGRLGEPLPAPRPGVPAGADVVTLLLLALQRGDLEAEVIRGAVELLECMLCAGFITAELEQVINFSLLTVPCGRRPGGVGSSRGGARGERAAGEREREQEGRGKEAWGVRVSVRNQLLEMLLRLQEHLQQQPGLEERLDLWHRTVTPKVGLFLHYDALHESSVRLVVTALCTALLSSPGGQLAGRVRANGTLDTLQRALVAHHYDLPTCTTSSLPP